MAAKDAAARKADERNRRQQRPWGYEQDLAQALGSVVIEHWSDLPHQVQQLLRGKAAEDLHAAVKQKLLQVTEIPEIETAIDIFMMSNSQKLKIRRFKRR